MKNKLWIPPVLLILAITCYFAYGEQPAQRQMQRLSGIFIESSTNWLSVQALEEKARAYVKEHDKNFNTDNVGFSLWIYANKSPHTVLISYNSGLGKPCWNVYFSDEKVSKYESGILSEGLTPQKTPAKRP